LAFFSKTIDQIFKIKLAVLLTYNAIFSPIFSGENILEIITSVPEKQISFFYKTSSTSNKQCHFFLQFFWRKYFRNHNIGPRNLLSATVLSGDLFLGNQMLPEAKVSLTKPGQRLLKVFRLDTALNNVSS
jgi:hypothetical protein